MSLSIDPMPILVWVNGQHILHGDWAVDVNGSRLAIPDGFRSDLSSIPRPFRVVVDRTELGHRAPLVHDFIYRYRGRLPAGAVTPPRVFRRSDADRYFLLLMKADGIGPIRRWAAWAGVRLGGWLPWPPARSAVRTTLIRGFHTFWQTAAAIALTGSVLEAAALACGFSLAKSSVWPWLHETIRSVTYE